MLSPNLARNSLDLLKSKESSHEARPALVFKATVLAYEARLPNTRCHANDLLFPRSTSRPTSGDAGKLDDVAALRSDEGLDLDLSACHTPSHKPTRMIEKLHMNWTG